MIVELLLAAILAVGSFLGLGHNGIGKGHYDYQGKGLGHAKHGDTGCPNCTHCTPICTCEPSCVPPCDGGGSPI